MITLLGFNHELKRRTTLFGITKYAPQGTAQWLSFEWSQAQNLEQPGARFSKTYRLRKAICKNMNNSFYKAVILTYL